MKASDMTETPKCPQISTDRPIIFFQEDRKKGWELRAAAEMLPKTTLELQGKRARLLGGGSWLGLWVHSLHQEWQQDLTHGF